MSKEENFLWTREKDAEELLITIVKDSLGKSKFISTLSKNLEKYTDTRLFDWIDHFILKKNSHVEEKLLNKGFLEEETKGDYKVFNHPKTLLPRVIVKNSLPGIVLKVESIWDFLNVHGLNAPIEGSHFSQYRRACVSKNEVIELWVVERRGSRELEPVYNSTEYLEKYFTAKEKFHSRPRAYLYGEECLESLIDLAKEISDLTGKDVAAHLFCECERKYWQSRNKAGQVQKNRQDKLGMGWANHDHHTFRSSRKHFSKLIQFFQEIGFHCREKFYAGDQAGWGAQVMENSNAGFSLFLDVDLSSEELDIDFSTDTLTENDTLGTIGLWCALHGESILKAGLHHLAGNFLFKNLTQNLEKENIKTMKPFSTFSYLKQAFTKGETWKVESHNISKLLKEQKIDQKNADKFLSHGAIGSHLENLQRREGFKGFNQENVSSIIKETDPRKS